MGVCFYLALGGATLVPRSFLSSRDPAQGAQTEGGRDSRIQRPGSQRRGDPQAWESQRPGDPETRKPEDRPRNIRASRHRCRFCLTPNCPTLKPRARSMGSIPGDALDSRQPGPPEQPNIVRLWTTLPRTACSTPAGMWREVGIPKRAHRNTPPCRTWGTSAWRYLVLHKWLQLLARTSLSEGEERGRHRTLRPGRDVVHMTVAPDTVTPVSVANTAGQEIRDKPEKPSCPVAVTRSGSHLPQTR